MLHRLKQPRRPEKRGGSVVFDAVGIIGMRVASILIDINLAFEGRMAVVTNSPLTRGWIVERKREVRAEPVQTERWEQNVRMILEQHPHFHGSSQFLRFELLDGVLRLNGCLPSFFLKQLAQEAMRDVEGVDAIDNCIVVANSAGDNRDAALRETPSVDKLLQKKKPR